MTNRRRLRLRVSWLLRRLNNNWRLISREFYCLGASKNGYTLRELRWYEHKPTGQIMEVEEYSTSTVL